MLENDVRKIKSRQISELLEEYDDEIKRYYCGISEKKWLNFIMNGIPIRSWRLGQKSICSLTKIGERKINTILNILFTKFKVSNKYELRNLLQKQKAIEILKMGYILLFDNGESSKILKIKLNEKDFYLTICRDVFKLSIGKFLKIKECKKYFEKKYLKE